MELITQRFETEDLEIKLLLESIFQYYNIDFRNYSFNSIKRRVMNVVNVEKLRSISALQEKILHEPEFINRFISHISVNVSEMFRNPFFYLALRKKVIPELRKQPFIRVWIAGCATGEELYSVAILLKEEGLYEKCKIYATDINCEALKNASSGIFPLNVMKKYNMNYLRSGGKDSFSQYYISDHKNVIFKAGLKEKVVFSKHNLVSDSFFNIFDLILCRNVMIYFNKDSQETVHRLLYKSLALSGFLCLGRKETLRFSPYEDCYNEDEERIYNKLK